MGCVSHRKSEAQTCQIVSYVISNPVRIRPFCRNTHAPDLHRLVHGFLVGFCFLVVVVMEMEADRGWVGGKRNRAPAKGAWGFCGRIQQKFDNRKFIVRLFARNTSTQVRGKSPSEVYAATCAQLCRIIEHECQRKLWRRVVLWLRHK